jgi:TfoX/Sxy family transcriptional regulator of competence genes
MAYDGKLDDRIAGIVLPWGATRKQMFGGTCYLLNGNMMAGVHKDNLIVRLGEQQSSAALDEAFVGPFDITGRPMRNWVMVAPEGLADDKLRRWLDRARAFAASLPPK